MQPLVFTVDSDKCYFCQIQPRGGETMTFNVCNQPTGKQAQHASEKKLIRSKQTVSFMVHSRASCRYNTWVTIRSVYNIIYSFICIIHPLTNRLYTRLCGVFFFAFITAQVQTFTVTFGAQTLNQKFPLTEIRLFCCYWTSCVCAWCFPSYVPNIQISRWALNVSSIVPFVSFRATMNRLEWKEKKQQILCESDCLLQSVSSPFHRRSSWRRWKTCGPETSLQME